MNVGLNVDGRELSAVSLEGFPLRGDEELLKVPGDVVPADGTPDEKPGVLHEGAGVVVWVGQLVFQVGKDRVCVCTVDVTLLKDGEVGQEAAARAHMLQGVQDLIVGAVLLQSRRDSTSCYLRHQTRRLKAKLKGPKKQNQIMERTQDFFIGKCH